METRDDWVNQENVAFPAEAERWPYTLPSLAVNATVEEVATVKLHSRLGGQHVHDSAAVWFVNLNRQ